MLNKYIFVSLFCFSTLFMSGFSKAASVSKKNSFLFSVEEKIAAHPRLLLKAGEEQKIIKLINTNSSMMKVHQCIINYANEVIAKPPLERVFSGKRLLDVSREAIKRIYFLSYGFRMTGETKYAIRAEQELLAVCEFKDWNPSHFLDVAEMCMAVSIGYDWLYSSLSPTSKEIIKKSIIDKALTFSNNDKHNYYYKLANNWNQVCSTGLAYGALAIYDEEPELSKQVIAKVVKAIPIATKLYEPDGAYPEGYTYWAYGTGFHVHLLAALESALGTDYDLAQNKAFLQTPHYLSIMVAPSGLSYNFGDSRANALFMPGMFWFASKLNKPSLLNQEQKFITKLNDCDFGEFERLLPSVLVFLKDLKLKSTKFPKINFFSTNVGKPLFIYRSGWKDKNDTYLGFVRGSASASHGHMDAGSFVYEKNGVRWAIELGLQEYLTLESKGVDLWNNKQNSQRWEVFRIGNTGHSTLTINREKHLVAGDAKIINTYKKKNNKGVEIDLSSVFSNSVQQVVRKVSLDKKNDLYISDKIKTKETVAQVAWQMIAPKDAKIIGSNQIEISKAGQKMILTVSSPKDVQMKLWSTTSSNSFDVENPGTVRVGFETSLPANTETELLVQLVSQK